MHKMYSQTLQLLTVYEILDSFVTLPAIASRKTIFNNTIGHTFEHKGQRLSCEKNCGCEWPDVANKAWLRGCRDECCIYTDRLWLHNLQFNNTKCSQENVLLGKRYDEKDDVKTNWMATAIIFIILLLISAGGNAYGIYKTYFDKTEQQHQGENSSGENAVQVINSATNVATLPTTSVPPVSRRESRGRISSSSSQTELMNNGIDNQAAESIALGPVAEES